LPDGTLVEEVEALIDGLAALARAERIAIVGGNLTRGPGPMVVDVTAIGTVHPRRVLTRGGGRAGDELYVSGAIGAGSAGLELLRSNGRQSHLPTAAACIERYRRPEARVRLGRRMAQSRAARAAMDSSDGLADAVRQVAEASGCGVELNADLLPIDPGARAWWESVGADPVTKALSGGDDYELLFAVPPRWRGRLRHARAHAATPPLTKIGVLTRTPHEFVVIRDGRRERLPGGFEHW
jgi:thiamine-monophosphate kinase